MVRIELVIIPVLGPTDHVWTVEEFSHTPILPPLARPDPSGLLAGASGVAVTA
jgi:hypothetical protein